ncbi:MAG: restriction endonuclease subunit S [Alcanivorax sp.]|nr:restriction endonuclease subunit S [Alcanivorax sp.]
MTEENDAPESWAQCTLADIVLLNPKNEASAEQTAGFVPMALAPTDYHGTLQHEEKMWGEIKKSYTNFADGDVIFAKVTPCFENGKAAIVRDMPSGIGAGSSEFYVLRPACEEVSPNLIFAIVKTQAFMQQGAENMTGAVGLRRVPRAFVESFPIALPPAAEQKVIADKLGILLAQVENTKSRLERIPKILKRFRQSILAAAASGQLTGDREAVDERCPATKLANLCTTAFDGPFGSKLKSSDYTGGGVGVVRLENIRHLRFDQSKKTFISEDKYLTLAKNKLEKNDILFSSFVDEEVRACLFPFDKLTFINKADCFCLRINQKEALPEFVLYLLTSQASYAQIKEHVQGITRPRVNLKILKSLEFSVPPIQTQAVIVRKADQLFAYADRIEQQVNAALTRVNNLTQSILSKAFRGELTEQWRMENPELISGGNSAEALLDRIRAERAKQKPARGGRRKKEATKA